MGDLKVATLESLHPAEMIPSLPHGSPSPHFSPPTCSSPSQRLRSQAIREELDTTAWEGWLSGEGNDPSSPFLLRGNSTSPTSPVVRLLKMAAVWLRG